VECAEQVAKNRPADGACWPVLALDDRALTLSLDIRDDSMITLERSGNYHAAEAHEKLADPLLEGLRRNAAKPAWRLGLRSTGGRGAWDRTTGGTVERLCGVRKPPQRVGQSVRRTWHPPAIEVEEEPQMKTLLPRFGETRAGV
jgi:hypothetical protein